MRVGTAQARLCPPYVPRPSLRAQRSNPSSFPRRDGLLRFARNDGRSRSGLLRGACHRAALCADPV